MVNIDHINDHGQTAYNLSQLHGHEEIMGVLVDAGASQLPALPCIVDGCDNECRVPHICEEVHPGR
jgi:ankyrin repeat protein|tara:strand:+ start:372 stop:569 length:198 start_codon:yes stop_codon:yes gene_type:complete